MSKRTILVHCLHGLRPPYLYQTKGNARNRCANHPGYSIIECSNQKQANELYNTKMEEYHQALNKSRVSILKANLEKSANTLEAEIAIPKQSKYIDGSQRTEREKIINELFVQHGYLPSPTFKSQPILVSPLAEYDGFFDGASRNNPGPSSAGYLLKYRNRTLLARGEFLGKLTNNQAELMGMGYLLAHSYCNGIKHLNVMGDSLIAIQFLKEHYEAKHPNTIPLVETNRRIASFFESIQFKHVKRVFNSEANKLAQNALPQISKQKKTQSKKE